MIKIIKLLQGRGTFTGAVKFNESDGQCINFDNRFYVNNYPDKTKLVKIKTNFYLTNCKNVCYI